MSLTIGYVAGYHSLAEGQVERRRAELREAMQRAHGEGISIAAIGRAAGVSRQRAAQMLRE